MFLPLTFAIGAGLYGLLKKHPHAETLHKLKKGLKTLENFKGDTIPSLEHFFKPVGLNEKEISLLGERYKPYLEGQKIIKFHKDVLKKDLESLSSVLEAQIKAEAGGWERVKRGLWYGAIGATVGMPLHIVYRLAKTSPLQPAYQPAYVSPDYAEELQTLQKFM